MKCVIIDNKPAFVVTLRNVLTKLHVVPDAIWPPHAKAINNWPDALQTLVDLPKNGIDPAAEPCVVFLDLALDKSDQQYGEGLQRIRTNKSGVLQPFVVIVCSMHSARANDLGVDGVLDKTEVEASEQSAVHYVETTVAAALIEWQRRTGRKTTVVANADWRWRDSGGARRADASLGSALVSELVSRETSGWRDVVVSALTGGYSGSYVLQLEGIHGGVRSGVVCKVSRSRVVLDSEMAAWKSAAKVYQHFVGLIPPVTESGPIELGRRAAWYAVQSAVPGVTLESLLLSSATGKAAQQVRKVIRRLREMAAGADSLKLGQAPEQLMFTKEDIDRFESSLGVLIPLAVECEREGFLPKGSITVDPQQLVHLVENWNDRLAAGDFALPCYFQHGDLNARNVLIAHPGHLQLIDFARSGMWPAMYDVARLELQTFARVCDVPCGRDMFPIRLKNWSNGVGWIRASSRNGPPLYTIFREGIESWISAVLKSAKRPDRSAFERAYYLSRCYDSLRMCSYQDISIFKRVHLLLVAARTSKELKLIA